MVVAVYSFALCGAPSSLYADEEVSISADAIMAHVRRLADKSLLGRKAGTPFEKRAAEYVSQQLSMLNVKPLPSGERIQRFPLTSKESGPESMNVFGFIAPSDIRAANELIVLGAHMDHLGEATKGGYYPGADDNASGVAVALEVAGALQRHAASLRRPVVVVFFGAEEIGLIGSKRFVDEGPIDNACMVAMVNIDMIGRPLADQSKLALLKRLMNIDDRNGIGVVGTLGRPFFQETIDAACTRVGLKPYGTQKLLAPIAESLARNRSDHAAFERVGIPTLFFGSGESDDYHRPTDTIDKLRPELMMC